MYIIIKIVLQLSQKQSANILKCCTPTSWKNGISFGF